MNTLHLIFGYSPGFYQYYLNNNNQPVNKEDQLKQQRLKMSTVEAYIEEYREFIQNANITGNTNNVDLLNARYAEFTSDRWKDFRDALDYLLDTTKNTKSRKVF
eukprot:UN06430